MSTTEKDRRIYYQDIVYAVCNALDRIDGKRPGTGIVCGTADEPSTEVQERMDRLALEFSMIAETCREARALLIKIAGAGTNEPMLGVWPELNDKLRAIGGLRLPEEEP